MNRAFHDEEEAPRYRDRWGRRFDGKTVEDVLIAVEECCGEDPRSLGRVLDLGAGDGLMIWGVTAAGKATFSVAQDISREMLVQMPSPEGPRERQILSVQSDAIMLPFRTHSFDTVIANAIFHHVPSPLRTAREVFRVLSPGGRLLVSGEATQLANLITGTLKLVPVFLLDTLRALSRKALSPTKQLAKKRPPDVYAFPLKELARCMRGAGFGAVRLETVGFASLLFRVAVAPWLILALRPRLGRPLEERIYRFLRVLDHRLLDRLLPQSVKCSIRLATRKPGRCAR